MAVSYGEEKWKTSTLQVLFSSFLEVHVDFSCLWCFAPIQRFNLIFVNRLLETKKSTLHYTDFTIVFLIVFHLHILALSSSNNLHVYLFFGWNNAAKLTKRTSAISHCIPLTIAHHIIVMEKIKTQRLGSDILIIYTILRSIWIHIANQTLTQLHNFSLLVKQVNPNLHVCFAVFSHNDGVSWWGPFLVWSANWNTV